MADQEKKLSGDFKRSNALSGFCKPEPEPVYTPAAPSPEPKKVPCLSSETESYIRYLRMVSKHRPR